MPRGLDVAPDLGLRMEGPAGGPFDPPSDSWTFEYLGDKPDVETEDDLSQS